MHRQLPEKTIIKFLSGARYEVFCGSLYSLNFAEKGLVGNTMGRKLPVAFADEVIDAYFREQDKKAVVKDSPKSKSKPKSTKKIKTTKSILSEIKLEDIEE